MRSGQSVVWAGAIALGLGACTDEGARPREEGLAGSPSSAVLPERAGGAAAAGTGGAAPRDAGSTSSALALERGEALEFVPGTGMVPYAIGPNPYGIRGGGFLASSLLGNTIRVSDTPGEICISGNLEEVPNGNYGQYWGVEIGFNLNQGLSEGAGGTPLPSGDAGADAASASDAAPPLEVAQPWLPGDVIGFSFVIEGPTIDLIRFKALPEGYDAALESSVFCKTITATSGQPQDALFTEMAQYCWNATANVLLPTSQGLDNISWQLPADVAVGERPFDWCLKELRPILSRQG